MAEATRAAYPVTLTGALDEPLSRWLWIFKIILLIPHLVVLAFLWIAFVLGTVFAFFSILFTGRYPRGMFDFNVGVIRWTWRAAFYGLQALHQHRSPGAAPRTDARDLAPGLCAAHANRER